MLPHVNFNDKESQVQQYRLHGKLRQEDCYTGTSSSQNNWIGQNQNANLPMEDVVKSMSYEETLSSVLQFLAQDAQYMDCLQHLQGTKTLGKDFLNHSDTSQHSDLVTHKEPAMPWNQSPELSHRNPNEDEGKGEQNWREEEAKEGEREEEEEEMQLDDDLKNEEKREDEELCPKKRSVSKSLMDTLWAKFKLNAYPTVQDSFSLSFEFSMTDKQIQQWFCKMRKKYQKEMSKQRHSKRLKK
ncbi:NANOG neighbor homeobox [Sciurus carolinensis]|uniref:NANOG neighbor homeobox n=1 Tax=Sciurus carolinensis TaxID=30640 RepID=UPI001FB37BA5|nr:NANOG neighbor homeobox [Sciurus carolinensis]